MAYTTVESVASFSVVLGEAFAAVGLSTIIPATFVSITRSAKAALVAAGTDAQARADALAEAIKPLEPVLKGPVKSALNVAMAAADTSDGIDLLIPKTAQIHAEFEFQGSESYSGEGTIGAMVEVVTVKAGVSALYATTSKNKITLDVDFAVAHYDI